MVPSMREVCPACVNGASDLRAARVRWAVHAAKRGQTATVLLPGVPARGLGSSSPPRGAFVTLAERARVAELPGEAILTRDEVAAWLALPPRQVDRLGVPELRLGHRTVRYRKADVAAWLEGRALARKG